MLVKLRFIESIGRLPSDDRLPSDLSSDLDSDLNVDLSPLS